MSDTPRRWLDPIEYSPEQHEKRQQARRRGEAEPRFEHPEYRQARHVALERAGLEPEVGDTDEVAKDLQDMTPEDFAREKYPDIR